MALNIQSPDIEKFPSSNSVDAESTNDMHWFAMRDLSRYNEKSPAYKILKGKVKDIFTPMHTVIKLKKGKRILIEEPILRDLLFIFDKEDKIAEFVKSIENLQFRFVKGLAYKQPLCIEKGEMERFKTAVETSYKEPVFIRSEDIKPSMYGKEVRIIGGNLNGYTGKLLKMRGSSIKRLIVELKGFFAVGVEVEPEFIEFV